MSCSPASSHAFESSPRRPEREAVVVAGGDRHVLRARVLEHAHPLLRVELRRTEPVLHAPVSLGVHADVLLVPLALRVVGVDAPVDEYPEALRGELLARLEVPLLGRVLCEERSCGEDECGCDG